MGSVFLSCLIEILHHTFIKGCYWLSLEINFFWHINSLMLYTLSHGRHQMTFHYKQLNICKYSQEERFQCIIIFFFPGRGKNYKGRTRHFTSAEEIDRQMNDAWRVRKNEFYDHSKKASRHFKTSTSMFRYICT